MRLRKLLQDVAPAEQSSGLLLNFVSLAHACVRNNSVAALKITIESGIRIDIVNAACPLSPLQEVGA